MSAKSLVSAALGLLLCVSLSAPARAQESPNQERGFDAGQAYQVGEIDAINLFNGNLTLTLDVGQKYPVGGMLDFGLNLVYNSNLWKFEEENNIISPTEMIAATVAEPDPVFNAGLGWMVNLGRLFAPNFAPFNDSLNWVYLDPDGSRHIFYATLHEGDSDAPNGGDYFYTRDGTYLRLRASTRTIEFPNGIKHSFGTSSHLASMSDRFDNSISVNTANALDWVVTDSRSRTHHIRFGNTFLNGARQISRIELAGWNGQVSAYDFVYANTTFYRTCKDTFWGNNNPPNANGVDQITVPLLVQINGPEGLVFKMKDGAGLPDYHLGTGPGSPALGSQCAHAGLIESLELPAKGKFAWTYQFWKFPKYTNDIDPHNHVSWGVGVAMRTLTNPFGAATTATWTYASTIYPNPGTVSNPSREVRTTVTDPTGAFEKHYFTAPNALNPLTFSGWEYGLPLTWETPSNGLYLSRETFNSAGSKVRSHWVLYEHDVLGPAPFQEPSGWYDSNRRVVASRTTFHDDGGKVLDTTSSDFDGLGHYRAQTRVSDFDPNVSDSKTTRVQYNGSTCYAVNPTTNTQTCTGSLAFTPPATSAPWVLDTFGYRQVNQGGIARTFTTFESGTGFLSCARILKTGTTRGANDVVVLYERDSSGNVTAESHYGGDLQSLDTSSNCSVTGSWTYRLEHTYSAGVRASTRYRKSTAANDFMPFYSYRADIDLNTGLPKTTYDTAGFPTAHTWDLLGRLKTRESASSVSNSFKGAKTTYNYVAAGSSSAKIGVLVSCPAGVTCVGGPYGQSEMLFDGFGRLWKERQLMADGTWSKRVTSRNPIGWTTTVSEQIPDAVGDFALLATRYQGFDAFGRPAKIIPPDAVDGNDPHAISLSYSGVRLESRTVKIANAAGVETSSVTTHIVDGQGRLTKVQDPAGTTIYEYDFGDRVKKVCQQAVGGTCGQTRLFSYDNRGFLTSESHPEKAGLVEYSGFDPRGHATVKKDGVASRAVLFDFDKAERIRRIWEDLPTPTADRLLKEWTYDNAPGWGSGKLHLAEGYNYFTVPPVTVKVIESYSYNEIEGRLSDKSTQNNVNGSNFELFSQTFDWDQAGNLIAQTYPSCTGGGCGSPGVASRNVGYSYTNGFLSAVPGWASSIGYHPNGLTASVVHSNGVTDTIAVASNWMARPTRISTAGVAVAKNFDSGIYAYDGAGNVKAIGTDTFGYDGLSRLTQSTVHLPSWVSAVNWTQGYSFDSYGNITQVTGTNARSTPTSATSNRLNAVGTTYDEAGNLTCSGCTSATTGTRYEYDVLNRMQKMTTAPGATQEIWGYVYTASDERFWANKLNGGDSIWSLRDLSANVIRQFESHVSWSSTKDSIYRGEHLLASIHPTEGTRHYHLDHLGSPRLVTDTSVPPVALSHHTYFPFGEEVPGSTVDTERLKFTGHERDLNHPAGTGDDLDYLHARFSSPITGRFLSTDLASGRPEQPQSWNRYAYTLGNPMRFVDPDGREEEEGEDLVLTTAKFAGEEIALHVIKEKAVARGLTGVATAAGVASGVGTVVFLIDVGMELDRRIDEMDREAMEGMAEERRLNDEGWDQLVEKAEEKLHTIDLSIRVNMLVLMEARYTLTDPNSTSADRKAALQRAAEAIAKIKELRAKRKKAEENVQRLSKKKKNNKK